MRIQMNHGFTLTELAVTLAAIAVLAFLLIILPISNSGHEPVSHTTCLHNQQQLAISILSYVQDNDETLPVPSGWVSATGLSSDPKIWACPETHGKGTPTAPNYGFNGRLYDLRTKGKSTSVQGVKLGEIPNPEQIECTMDLKANYLAPTQNPNPAQVMENGQPVVYSFGNGARFCHNNGVNVSYLDGHVATLTEEASR